MGFIPNQLFYNITQVCPFSDLRDRLAGSNLLLMWLSATAGDKSLMLARLDLWSETEVVNNERKKLEAEETVRRDIYTGQRLHN